MAFSLSGRRSVGELTFLCSGSVLGQPLKRSRSPREDSRKNIHLFFGDLASKNPVARL